MLLTYLDDLWAGLAVIGYALSAIFLFRNMDQHDGRLGSHVVALLLVGAGAHALTLLAALFGGSGLSLDLGNALSLAAWVVLILFLAATTRQRLASLGLIVVPYALICVLLDRLWTGAAMGIPGPGSTAIIHTLISVVAYGLLALSFCQAVVLLFQEWHLQNRRQGSFFHSLPPLESMERILFQIIALGFSLLTIALISGGVFATELFGRAFVFNHHVVLSVVAWLAFGALLVGRVIWGWRGRVAAFWTIGSFLLLALSYFGTRFVLEVILQRV